MKVYRIRYIERNHDVRDTWAWEVAVASMNTTDAVTVHLRDENDNNIPAYFETKEAALAACRQINADQGYFLHQVVECLVVPMGVVEDKP